MNKKAAADEKAFAAYFVGEEPEKKRNTSAWGKWRRGSGAKPGVQQAARIRSTADGQQEEKQEIKKAPHAGKREGEERPKRKLIIA